MLKETDLCSLIIKTSTRVYSAGLQPHEKSLK